MGSIYQVNPINYQEGNIMPGNTSSLVFLDTIPYRAEALIDYLYLKKVFNIYV